jgi:PAS domain-containing protein
LLDTICDRISDLDRPAYVKNSERVFVAANQALAQLFNLSVGDLVGAGPGDYAKIEALIDLEDKERSCIVFGEDQRALHSDPFGKGRYIIEIERFTLADGQSFLYCVFNPQGSIMTPDDGDKPAPVKLHVVPAPQPIADKGGLTGELAEYIIEDLVAGICIYDKDDRLI